MSNKVEFDCKAGDGPLGTVLSRGLFSGFGVDLSTKLNQSKIFHPLPYVDFQLGESGAKDIFFNALAGPSGTTGVNFFRGGEYVKQGDVFKGIEYAAPKGIRTAMESYRLATEGYTMRNGDVIVDPREIDALACLLTQWGYQRQKFKRLNGHAASSTSWSNTSAKRAESYARSISKQTKQETQIRCDSCAKSGVTCKTPRIE